VFDGGVARTDTGEVWVTIDERLMLRGPGPIAPGAACASVNEVQPGWVWLFPTEPGRVLALGQDAGVYVWDPQQSCSVLYPVLIAPTLPQMKVLNAGAHEPTDLSVIEVDLFPDIPGNEILSVGTDGFRVDRGAGPGAIRTGRYGLPITRTETRPAPGPPEAL